MAYLVDDTLAGTPGTYLQDRNAAFTKSVAGTGDLQFRPDASSVRLHAANTAGFVLSSTTSATQDYRVEIDVNGGTTDNGYYPNTPTNMFTFVLARWDEATQSGYVGELYSGWVPGYQYFTLYRIVGGFGGTILSLVASTVCSASLLGSEPGPTGPLTLKVTGTSTVSLTATWNGYTFNATDNSNGRITSVGKAGFGIQIGNEGLAAGDVYTPRVMAFRLEEILLVDDTLGGTSGTLLQNRSAAFTKDATFGTASFQFRPDASSVRMTVASAATLALSSAVPASADYRVEVDGKPGAFSDNNSSGAWPPTNMYMYAASRWDEASQTGYLAEVYAATTGFTESFSLYRYGTNGAALISNQVCSSTLYGGTGEPTSTIALTVTGDNPVSLTATWNGYTFTATDSSVNRITRIGKAGFGAAMGAEGLSAGDVYSPHFNAFRIEDLVPVIQSYTGSIADTVTITDAVNHSGLGSLNTGQGGLIWLFEQGPGSGISIIRGADDSVTITDSVSVIPTSAASRSFNDYSVITDSIIWSYVVVTLYPIPVITTAPSTESVSYGANGVQNVTLTWQSNVSFVNYKIKLVNSIYDIESSGITLGTTNGSTNVAGSATINDPYLPNAGITTTIDGNDIKAISTPDGTKIIKIFIRDSSGAWST